MRPYNLHPFASCGDFPRILFFATLSIASSAHLPNAQAQNVDGGDGIACTLQFQIGVQTLEDVEDRLGRLLSYLRELLF